MIRNITQGKPIYSSVCHPEKKPSFEVWLRYVKFYNYLRRQDARV